MNKTLSKHRHSLRTVHSYRRHNIKMKLNGMEWLPLSNSNQKIPTRTIHTNVSDSLATNFNPCYYYY